MEALQQAIREIVQAEVSVALSSYGSLDPELITIEQAADIMECSKVVVLDLFKDRDNNGFPGILLGARTLRIDKRRLNVWFAGGGLGANGIDNKKV